MTAQRSFPDPVVALGTDPLDPDTDGDGICGAIDGSGTVDSADRVSFQV
jgi:hypothetical protein